MTEWIADQIEGIKQEIRDILQELAYVIFDYKGGDDGM